MTDTTTTMPERTLVKGHRDAGPGYAEVWGIRDMSATRGPDVAIFDTEVQRDAALASPETLYFNLHSDENGGNWRAPLTWGEPATPDVDWATAEEEPVTRESQANALAVMRRREAAAEERARVAEHYRDQAREELQRLQERVSALNDALNEEAEERDWCSEFEGFVERFPDLLKVHTVTFTVAFEAPRGTSPDTYGISDWLYDLPSREAIRNTITDVS